ncbi:hypothetical protein [Xanthobacter sp. ZOL 2024]
MKNDGGPAFPVPDEGQGWGSAGITMRDYFAAQIASGMAAYSGTSGVSYGPSEIAGRSYQVADAMIKAREASDEIG